MTILERAFAILFENVPAGPARVPPAESEDRHPGAPEIIRSRTGAPFKPKISRAFVKTVLYTGQAILGKEISDLFPDASDPWQDSLAHVRAAAR